MTDLNVLEQNKTWGNTHSTTMINIITRTTIDTIKENHKDQPGGWTMDSTAFLLLLHLLVLLVAENHQ
jgi:hypothetical protein